MQRIPAFFTIWLTLFPVPTLAHHWEAWGWYPTDGWQNYPYGMSGMHIAEHAIATGQKNRDYGYGKGYYRCASIRYLGEVGVKSHYEVVCTRNGQENNYTFYVKGHPNPKNLGPSCSSVGNPINFTVGNKFQAEVDYSSHGPFPIELTRHYSRFAYRDGAFGYNWNVFPSLTQISQTEVKLLRRDQKEYAFRRVNGNWVADADITDTLVQLTDSAGKLSGWKYLATSTDGGEITESYSNSGQLVAVTDTRTGVTRTFSYSDGTNGPNGGHFLDDAGNATTQILPHGLLTRMTDSFNRSLHFGYSVGRKVVKVMLPDGGSIRYAYDQVGNLIAVTYPDGKVRAYHYDEPEHVADSGIRNALTGITDNNGVRYGTYKYDSLGRAVSTQSGGVNQFVLDFGIAGKTKILDPLGTSRDNPVVSILGVLKSAGQSQPGGSGCGPASTNITYDTNGNVTTRTDFNGSLTTYTYDLTRNLETKRVEASGKPEERTVSTQWHPAYRLPVKIAEPQRITTNTYDDHGNLLQKTVQATTDVNGAQGFAATVTGTPRSWSYTYNAVGQVLTITDPLGAVTTNTYDNQGNLTTVTNAAGHITTLSDYDPNGRVGKITDPNGRVTTLMYSSRGWLTSRTVGGDTTRYDYDGVGQLKKVTLPDTTTIDYTHDDAHRLTGMSDSAGNRIVYTLDAMGNRIKEEVMDPDGVLTGKVTRVYDALNRLQQITGGVQ